MRHCIYIILFSTGLGLIQAQTRLLSDQAQVSVLTGAASTQLHSAFGHTAFRVQDPRLGLDIVYDYGTFDVEQPYFYAKFVRGKLNYALSRRPFRQFLFQFQYENRWIQEQILDLSTAQVQEFYSYLEHNYRPENRYYLYDYLYDNCSTVTGDILTELYPGRVEFKDDHLLYLKTFRQLLRENLHFNTWYALGIDLALGAVVDQKANVREQMFLPYYNMEQLRYVELDGRPVVRRERPVLDYPEKDKRMNVLLSPLLFFSWIFLGVLAITIVDLINKTRVRWLDPVLLSMSSLVGLLAFFLWFGTDHEATANNLNILWAFPLNLLAGISLWKRAYVAEWVAYYLWLLLAGLLTIPVIWLLGVQEFPYVLIPFFLSLLVRYLYLLYRYYRMEEYTS